ncbi:MAG: hypothetical protein J5835_02960 [Bacteroidales bacterium]|nr:hypothetical protein [Bacteroidales bacterium]
MAAGLCLLSCSVDPDVTIYESLDFPQCLRPVNLQCTVDNLDITVDMKTFSDSEAIQLEVYSSDFRLLPEGEEPSQDDLLFSATIPSNQLPYTFKGPAETTCYIRLRAVNETKKKEPSEWVTTNVKTTANPSTTCISPTDVKVNALFKRLTFQWTAADNVAEYLVEIYKEKSAPATGDRNPEDENFMFEIRILPSQLPYNYEVTVDIVDYDNYYYRVQGRNDAANLEPSKWVRGSFKLIKYWWRDWESSFDFELNNTASRQTSFNMTTIKAQLKELNDGEDKTSVPDGKEFTWEKITYGPGCQFYDDKFSFNRCKKWDEDTYAQDLPLECYETFEISQPGILSFIPKISDVSKVPEVVVGLLTKKSEEAPSFEYIYQKNLAITGTITEKNEENRLNIEIKKDHVYGIIEPARVYIFCNLQGLTVYPIKWIRTNPDTTE